VGSLVSDGDGIGFGSWRLGKGGDRTGLLIGGESWLGDFGEGDGGKS